MVYIYLPYVVDTSIFFHPCKTKAVIIELPIGHRDCRIFPRQDRPISTISRAFSVTYVKLHWCTVHIDSIRGHSILHSKAPG